MWQCPPTPAGALTPRFDSKLFFLVAQGQQWWQDPYTHAAGTKVSRPVGFQHAPSSPHKGWVRWNVLACLVIQGFAVELSRT